MRSVPGLQHSLAILPFRTNFNPSGRYCTAGRSRSAALVAAYLMLAGERLLSHVDALRIVQQARRWICPNGGFVRQLALLDNVIRASGGTCAAICPKPVSASECQHSSCELCRLETSKRTPWLNDSDPRFVVVICDQCDLPMAVWRAHTMRISELDARDMESALISEASRHDPAVQWWVDKKQRTIPDHLHWHAREKDDMYFVLRQLAERRGRYAAACSRL